MFDDPLTFLVIMLCGGSMLGVLWTILFSQGIMRYNG